MKQPVQYVQHISGQGKKWSLHIATSPEEVIYGAFYPDVYFVKVGERYLHLPKSEYQPCDPPTVWKDVTGECNAGPEQDVWHLWRLGIGGARRLFNVPSGYRIRKVKLFDKKTDECTTPFYMEVYAFIIEQEQPSGE